MKLQRRNSFLLLFIVSIIWGLAAPIIKFTGATFPPALFLAYRFLISSVIGVYYFYTHQKELRKILKNPQEFVGHSFFTVILGLGFLFLGFNYTDAVTGSLLVVTGPLFVIIAGAVYLREKVTKHEVFGLGLALFGSGIITVPTGQLTLSLELLSLFGAFCIILSRLFDAMGQVYIKRALQHKIEPETITHTSFLIGFIVFSLVSLFILPVEQSVTSIIQAPLSAHLGVFYMALISGTFAYTLAGRALKHLHIGEASMFTYITPLWAAPVAVLWLKEPISGKFIIGALFITVGVIIAEWKNRKKRLVAAQTKPRSLTRRK